jgi:hypothetical protein
MVDCLRSTAYDVLMVFIIVVYSGLIVVYFTIEDESFFTSDIEHNMEEIEFILLGIFCIDVVLNCIAFRRKYIPEDKWNIADVIIIALSYAFVILDYSSTNPALSGFLKIRGLFRLFRIFILMRKLSAIRNKRENLKK